MLRIVLIIIFFIISVLLQHVTHELMHVFVGKKQGFVITKIQWFTYHGGTKVFVEGEEEVVNGDVPITKAWVYMNAAGIFGTTLLAYVFWGIYLLFPMGYLKLFLWELAMVFLLTDCGYFLLCAFGDCGDMYLVNKYLGAKSKWIKVCAVAVFVMNCFMARLIWD